MQRRGELLLIVGLSSDDFEGRCFLIVRAGMCFHVPISSIPGLEHLVSLVLHHVRLDWRWRLHAAFTVVLVCLQRSQSAILLRLEVFLEHLPLLHFTQNHHVVSLVLRDQVRLVTHMPALEVELQTGGFNLVRIYHSSAQSLLDNGGLLGLCSLFLIVVDNRLHFVVRGRVLSQHRVSCHIHNTG